MWVRGKRIPLGTNKYELGASILHRTAHRFSSLHLPPARSSNHPLVPHLPLHDRPFLILTEDNFHSNWLKRYGIT